MSHRPRILGISGSLRRGSYNTALLMSAAEQLSEGVDFERAVIVDLPLYNRDIEALGFPVPVARVREQAARCDGILFASPEYNFSVTGVLKNAIDWLSRGPASPIDLKPAGLLGGAGRSGAARSLDHLRQILGHNHLQVLLEPVVRVVGVRDVFDAELRLVDEGVRNELGRLAKSFEALVAEDRLRRPGVVLYDTRLDLLRRSFASLVGRFRIRVAATDAEAIRLAGEMQPAVLVMGAGVDPELRSDVAMRAASAASGIEVLEVADGEEIEHRLSDVLDTRPTGGA